ncbi:MAG: hypothetical protein RBR15_14845 [Sphaerochaeta sp.]|nr:hypothetical protein [Sphaerochaeta sp.]
MTTHSYILSQDCDLLNPSLENEPFAEFFCGPNIIKVDTSLAYGKNPRKIHLAINTSTSLSLSINHRIRIDRVLLSELSLENYPVRLPDSSLTNLLAQIPALDKKLKKLNDTFKEIKSIFFYLSPDGKI